MSKNLLLSFAVLCTMPVLNAQVPATNVLKGHVVNRCAASKPHIRPLSTLNPRLAPDANSASLFESFETGGDRNFINGWTTQSTNELDWYVGMPGYSSVEAPDGYYAAFATCFTPHEASWLISPEFTPGEGEQLMFDLYFDVRSLYVWSTTGDNKNIDEEDGLILKRENAENMKICISVDGGEWVELKNLWDDYGSLGYWTIMDEYSNPEFRHFIIPMDEYVGKNVKLGFCHQYLNEDYGYGMFLDAVRVSLPPVETSYMLPMGMLFWGMTNNMEPMYNTAIVPYNTPIDWFNTTYAEDLSYNWEYMNILTEQTFTSTEVDLSATYVPDYTENPEATHTIYSFPTLTATNAAGTSGTYTYADGMGTIFAGSHPELPAREGGMMNFGMTTFDPADDLQVYNADYSTPAFGYSPMTRDWWTNHYFEGEHQEGDLAEITSNINFFYTNGAPIVIEGVRVVSLVECEPDAEFKLEIVTLDEEFVPSEVVATATLKGSELLPVDEAYSPFPETYILPFKFETPVVVDGCNFYVNVSGFNSDKVTYYAPMQSYEPKELCYSFATLHIKSERLATEGDSMIPAALEDNYVSYIMMLDASYPYLVCKDNEFESTDEVTSKTFALESSYPAEELEIKDANGTLPEWIEIEKSGRYGNTKIKVTVVGGEEGDMANLTVSAPGVSQQLVVKHGGTTGMSSIETSGEAECRLYFDLSGRQLVSEPETGVYIVKTVFDDGSTSVEKVVK